LSDGLKEALRNFLPAAASVGNPIDMVASAGPQSYRRTVEALLTSSEVDAVIVMYIPLDRQGSDEFAVAIREGVELGRSKGAIEKPVLACVMSDGIAQAGLVTSRETIPVYEFPETPANVLAKCVEYSEWKSTPEGIAPALPDLDTRAARQVIDRFKQSSRNGWLSPDDVERILTSYGIPVPARSFARTAADAVSAAERIGYPVALKLASTTIVHKSDVGGVQLNLKDRAAVIAAFERIQSELVSRQKLDAMDGVVVQQMISGGLELMAGATLDASFGPLIAFGLGGVYVEILGDVRFRIAPLTDLDARAMVRDIRGFRLLEGYRGHPAADIRAVEDVLLRLSRIVEDLPEITELDLNPFVALPPGQGCCVLDARIHVQS
jgi:acyl-CoA synthetase (NDP forming)